MLSDDRSESSDLIGDVLFQICVQADISTLQKLSLTSIWTRIREFATKESFWFSRVQARCHKGLHWRTDISWRDVERTIEHMNSRRALDDRSVSVSEFIERFCLENQTPNEKDLSFFEECCLSGSVSLVQELLRSGQIPFQSGWLFINDLFSGACARGHVGVVRTILADGRIDPLWPDFRCLRDACTLGRVRIVALLIQDKRYDWGWHKELVIETAPVIPRDQELLEILAQRGLIDWAVQPLWMVMAILALLACF